MSITTKLVEAKNGRSYVVSKMVKSETELRSYGEPMMAIIDLLGDYTTTYVDRLRHTNDVRLTGDYEVKISKTGSDVLIARCSAISPAAYASGIDFVEKMAMGASNSFIDSLLEGKAPKAQKVELSITDLLKAVGR